MSVPYPVEVPDRIPKERYYDPGFYALEAEQLWPRVWQMACRLEEIPGVRDFVEYAILDQSVVVVRTAETEVAAFQNACRHRGVKVVEGRGTLKTGFTCPFHGWCYGLDGKNTFVSKARSFSEHNLAPGEIDLVPVRTELWGGCVWINLDDDAPPLRSCIEPFASILDAWKVEAMRTEWWEAFVLPVNWKLAQEAFLEQYHVIETHPELVIPKRFAPKDPAAFDPEVFIDAELHYLHVMSEGMGGMVHAHDVAVAERQRTMSLSSDPHEAMATWHHTLNEAVVAWHTARGSVIPDLNELEAQGINETMFYAFPHYFVLPMYSSATSYRFRPLGPEETLMEIWSLTRYPEGQEPGPPTPPVPRSLRRRAHPAHSHAGLLQPAAPTARPAQRGLRVHAPLGGRRGRHRQLRAHSRRLLGGPPLRPARDRPARREREPSRAAHRRSRVLRGDERP